MATKKLSDLFAFNQITNPAGGLNMSLTTPSAVLPKAPAAPIPIPSPLSRLDLNGVGTPPVVGITNQNVLPPALQTKPTLSSTFAGPSAPPIPTPSTAGPSSAPVGPTGATGATGGPVPSQYMNTDGSLKTPEQVADAVGNSLAAAHGNADVGTLTARQFGPDGTTEDAIAAARNIDNTRNDIAAGETDPYGVGGSSGIAYTPAELQAIQSAYAGIYDPALDTALAKVQTKQDADKAKAASDQALALQKNAPFTLGKDDVRYDGQGNPIAVGVSSSTAPSTYVAGANPIVDAYVTGFKNGTYKASDIPDVYKDAVAQGIAAASAAAPLSKTSLDALGIISQIAADPGIDAISGTRGIIPTIPGTEPAQLTNLTKQLAATIALGNRTQLKGQGAISDFEFKVLGDAATSLGIDSNGHTNLSPQQFKDGLANLELKLQVGPLKTLTDDQVRYLASPAGGSATPEEIRALDDPTSFNSAGNASASKVSLNGGNIPQRNNNPGDVKAGGLADNLAIGKDQYGHLIFPDAATGFRALTADLTAKINGGSSHLPANPTIAQLGKVYAEDPNWGTRVAAILGVSSSTPTKSVPIDQLAHAVATQEGFYA